MDLKVFFRIGRGVVKVEKSLGVFIVKIKRLVGVFKFFLLVELVIGDSKRYVLYSNVCVNLVFLYIFLYY